MAQTIQIKRGLEANRTTITPAVGELLWTTDGHKLFMGDGSTAGGIDFISAITSNYILTSEKGIANGVATLDSNAKIPSIQLPALAITDTFVVASESAMLALTAQTGDVAIRTDVTKNFILRGSDPQVLSDWQELAVPAAPVTSVNGEIGVVVLDTDNIAEGTTNLYYTDARVDTRVGQTNIEDLLNVDSASATDGQMLYWDNTNSKWIAGDAPSGIDTFVGLTDTPTDFTGSAGKLVQVNVGGTALEFTDIIDGGTF